MMKNKLMIKLIMLKKMSFTEIMKRMKKMLISNRIHRLDKKGPHNLKSLI